MNTKRFSKLFWMFIKVNMLSTSGPASVGLLYKESVGTVMTEKEFVEAVGFSSILPGSDALQLALFVGYAAGGTVGAFIALAGSILPPTLLMLSIALILEMFQGQTWLQGFVAGLTPAVAMLMVTVAWQLLCPKKKNCFRVQRPVVLIIFVSLLALVFGVPSPLVLLGAGLTGVILLK